MSRATHEVADVIRLFGDALLAAGPVSPARRRVMRALVACRTSRLGGHVEACDSCGYQRIAYNSCRNRHCPKCQGSRQAQWLEDRARDLLPVEYFHVVFTVPEEVAAIALQNKRVLYGTLFTASAATLRTIAADRKHLGAEIGFVSVLHTWSQDLRHHPHVHCVVPGGGLAPDGSWVACRPGFFLPVRVLGAMFRGKFARTRPVRLRMRQRSVPRAAAPRVTPRSPLNHASGAIDPRHSVAHPLPRCRHNLGPAPCSVRA